MFDFLAQKFSAIFDAVTKQKTLTESAIDATMLQVKDSLLEADVPHALVEQFIEAVKAEVVGTKVLKSLRPQEQLVKIVHDRLCAFLGGTSQPFSFQIPSVIMVLGLQGSGKTTSLGKLAVYLKKQAQEHKKERRILLASVDFYRPAAIDQLEILARQNAVSFYRAQSTDPVKAAQECYAVYKKEGFEYLLLDTAGRLHIDGAMLQELRDIDAQLSPRYKLLVLDAMTGQESLSVAQAFEQGVGFTGAVLSKIDSDTRGGAAFSFRYMLKKPILFIGTGEKSGDLELFHPERMAGRILGMGDVVTLAEKAAATLKVEEQKKIEQSMAKGRFTLQDFADQLAMMGKIGSLSQVMKYMPAMGGMKVSPDQLEKGEQELKKFKAIISSMTPKERVIPALINASRKQRIARGAGVVPSDVGNLLTRFEEMQQFVKLFKGSKRFPRFF